MSITQDIDSAVLEGRADAPIYRCFHAGEKLTAGMVIYYEGVERIVSFESVAGLPAPQGHVYLCHGGGLEDERVTQSSWVQMVGLVRIENSQRRLLAKSSAAFTEDEAVAILKKHASAYGDSRYEPARWVVDAMMEAAKHSSKENGDGDEGFDH